MSDEKTYTLAEVRVLQREAYRRACLNESMSYDRAEELARTAYPDPEPPEPERRWVETAHQTYCARDPDGSWWTRSEDGKVFRAWQYGDVLVAALASLLPRVPVEVTPALQTKAENAYRRAATDYPSIFGIKAALTAVAADLAATPAAALIAAGRKAAPGVLCYCGRSGYSATCPTHGKTPNDDKGGTTDGG